jgi:type IV fimbrial biogenesis protein FimT
LLALAVPGMDDASLNGKLRSQASAFLSTLHLARSEAIKRNARVAVCKSSDGDICTETGGWDQGWIVFHDRNNDGNRVANGDNEPDGTTDEHIIERHQQLATGFSLTGDDDDVASSISFGPTGMPVFTSEDAQSGALTLCRFAPTVAESGRKIQIRATGRARIERVEDLAGCPPPLTHRAPGGWAPTGGGGQ